MFASTKTKDITIRDDDANRDVVVTVRKLSWKQLRAASEAQTGDAVKAATTAGPELLRAMRDVAGAADGNGKGEAPKKDPNDRYRAYQREAVLTFGVARWSLDIPVKAGIEDLDEPTADRLHREIIDLSVPADAEGARGEGSGTSTAS